MFSSRTAWNLARNRYSEELERLRNSGARILDLTASNPTKCGFQFQEDAILEALRHREALVYDPQPRGMEVARRAVCKYYDEHRRRAKSASSIDIEQVCLTTGTSEGYSFLFRLLCNPGDQVLIPRPGYPLFDFLAEIQDVRLAPYPLQYDHGWHIDFAALEAQINECTRAIIAVHPNNPTGSFVSSEEMEHLAGICVSNRLSLIADEVFLDYAFANVPVRSFAFNASCLTFVLSGLSKISCLPQMKAGWIIMNGPADLRKTAEDRLEVIADTYLSLSAPLQLALPALLEQRRQIQPQVCGRIQRNLSELDRRIKSQELITRLEIQGGWYAVLRLPATRSDEEMSIALMREHGVVVHPGHFYDFPRDGHLVLSLITPVDVFEEGVGRLFEFPFNTN